MGFGWDLHVSIGFSMGFSGFGCGLGLFDGSFMPVKNMVVKKWSGILRRCMMGFGKCGFEDFKAHPTRCFFFSCDVELLPFWKGYWMLLDLL